VDVQNDQFIPNSVTIQPGGTVLWVWSSTSRRHNILPVSPGTKPSSPTVRDGPFSHEETFTTAGTYPLFLLGARNGEQRDAR
jgi:plastocyanin